MEFRIVSPPEPFSEVSTAAEQSGAPEVKRPVLARSDAYDRLYHAMQRYTLGEISGRSFLISGHRGAGKTTLVGNAIQDLYRAFRDAGRRPLYVRVHGPDLLPKTLPQDPRLPDNASTEDRHLCNVMTQIAIALYRAAAEEFVTSYRERVRKRQNVPLWQKTDFYESAAQLAHDLEDCPTIEDLREYWDRVGLLEKGVLFAQPEMEDQGMLEIVALSVACQAYQVVSGKWEEEHSETAEADEKTSLAIAAVGEIKNIVGPVVGLLSGGAVAAALFGEHPIGSVFLGLASAVTISSTFTYSLARSRERKETHKNTFSKDRTVSSLGRMLPMLLGQFRKAGLHPIFVVDELDKVENLPQRMKELISYLKFFVSDRAFFCFLTDRRYMEYLECLTSGNTYAAEYSYFRERIPVFYEPHDLRTYLQSIFEAGNTSGPGTDSDSVDHLLLTYSLLHRARLHPLDLRRELGKITSRDGIVRISEHELHGGRVKFELLFQLAIEWELSSPEMKSAIRSSARFAQLAYDALYYPSRSWEEGERTLDMSEASVVRYIQTRLAWALDGDMASAGSVLSPRDTSLLMQALRRLVYSLQNTDELVSEFKLRLDRERPDERVLDFVPVGEKFQLLKRVGTDQYEWRFNAYGQSTREIGVGEVIDQTRSDIAFIHEIREFVLAQTDGKMDLKRLADFHLLFRTPPWATVCLAIERITQLATIGNELKPAYEGMRDDANNIYLYATRVRQSGGLMAQVLCCATALANYTDAGNAGDDRVSYVIRILSTALQLKEAGEDSIRQRIQSLYRSLQALTSVENAPEIDHSSAEWETATARNIAAVRLTKLQSAAAMKSQAWTRWWERFEQYLQFGTTKFDPSIEDLWQELDFSIPPLEKPVLLSLNLANVSIDNWSWMFRQSLQQNDLPAWLWLPAAMQLGFPQFAYRGSVDSRIASEQVPAFEEWLRIVRSSVRNTRGALLIRASEQTLTSTWLPSAKYPVLSVEQEGIEQLMRAVSQLGFASVQEAGIDRVFMELTGDPTTLAAKLRNPLHSNLNVPFSSLPADTRSFLSLPCTYLVAERPAETADKLPYPYVVAPGSVEELIQVPRSATAAA